MSDMSSGSPFAMLDMQGADMQPLSPVHFIDRVAYVFAKKTAIAYGARRISYAEFGKRCKQLAAAIIGSGTLRHKPRFRFYVRMYRKCWNCILPCR